jgi:hypothetical protein
LAGETKVLEENLPQHHFVDHKSHITRPGLEPGPPWWEVAVGNESSLVNTSQLNRQLLNCFLNSLTNESLTELNSRMNSLLPLRETQVEITAAKGSITALHECILGNCVLIRKQWYGF